MQRDDTASTRDITNKIVELLISNKVTLAEAEVILLNAKIRLKQLPLNQP